MWFARYVLKKHIELGKVTDVFFIGLFAFAQNYC